jgi:GntR family transcriptional regulator/MocR family aminotransferase
VRLSSTLPLANIIIDRSTTAPVEQQMYDAIARKIQSGIVRSGTQLPSSRLLAAQVGVARNTVIAVYQRLAMEGLVRSHGGSGTYVAFSERVRPAPQHTSRLKLSTWATHAATRRRNAAPSAHCGTGSEASHRWVRHIAAAWRRPCDAVADPQGCQELRDAIAESIATLAGIQCSAEEIIIAGSIEQVIQAAARALADPCQSVLLQPDCDEQVRDLFECVHLRPLLAAMDEEGMQVEIQYEPMPALAYVTPSRQNAGNVVGNVMSIARRYLMMEWAKRRRIALIEDDFDALLEGATPLPPSLKAIDSRGVVIYAGTFSRVALPELPMAFAIAPPEIAAAMARGHGRSPVSTAEQWALARFIREGDFARHLAEVRSMYAARRTSLTSALHESLSSAVVAVRHHAPLQLLVELTAPIVALAVARNARASGVLVEAIGHSTILISYEAIAEAQITGMIASLGEAIEASVRSA